MIIKKQIRTVMMLAVVGIAILVLTTASVNAAVLRHYAFDGDFTDTSGNAQHGTRIDKNLDGDTNLTSDPNDFMFGTGGFTERDNDRDHVEIPPLSFAADQAWTVSAWSRKANPDDRGMIIGDDTNTWNFIWDAETQATGGFRVRNGSGQNADFQGTSGIPNDTQWHHWVVIADGAGSITLYLDGVFRETKTFSTHITFNALASGYSSNQFSLIGELDEVWILDEAIDEATVISLYQTNTLSASGLMTVNAGTDMATWSGEPVLLDPNVIDLSDPPASLTYAWTVDAASLANPNLSITVSNPDQINAAVEIVKIVDTGDATVVTMTLAVTPDGQDPVVDTMTIDVYDNACELGKAAGLAALDPSDLNDDCVTNLEDIVELINEWLVESTITAPANKP